MCTQSKCLNAGKCGCGDTSISVPATYSNNESICPTTTSSCSEVFDANCVCYNGPDIVEMGITRGTRIDEVMQKLVLLHTNAACATFDGTVVHSPLNITVSAITDTSFNIVWSAVPTATSYVVEYKLAASAVWTVNTAVTITSDSVVALTAGEVYDIRVQAVGGTSCYSLNYRIETLTV